jgi:hypothetical protein
LKPFRRISLQARVAGTLRARTAVAPQVSSRNEIERESPGRGYFSSRHSRMASDWNSLASPSYRFGITACGFCALYRNRCRPGCWDGSGGGRSAKRRPDALDDFDPSDLRTASPEETYAVAKARG